MPGVKPAKVFVIGAGVVGTAAARTAAGTGADVTICDVSLRRLTYLADVMPRNVKTLMSSEYNIREELKHADLVVGSVLIPGAKAPKLVTRDMLKLMEPGTVMVDVAIDQGGCFEMSRPTTHEDPVYYVDGILHYCVANIPGAVPYTSTLALTNATLPYALQLADKGGGAPAPRTKSAARSEHRRREGRLPLGGRSVGASLRAAAKLIRTVSDDPAARRRPDPFAETGCFSGSAAGPDRAGVGTCAGVRRSVCVFARICLYSPL